MQLLDLLKQNEGKSLEFKRDLSSPEGVLKCIIAFANTSGGTLLIGVEDGTKNVRGVPDVLGTEERLANLIADSIAPKLIPDIQAIPWRKLNILRVDVHPSNTRPHHLKKLGPEAGVFIRVGSSNRRADRLQIEDMTRWNRVNAFDEQTLPDLNSEALDFRAASELFADLRPLTPQSFATLRITAEYHRKQVPTIGGLLLFGKDRFAKFPDSWIQCGRFAGRDRTSIADSRSIRSLLPRAAEEALDFIRKHLTVAAVIKSARREERWSIPVEAIREALMNAIVHADYAQQGAPIRVAIFDDRIEIDNPGLLPFGLTIEEIQTGISKVRNRVIGRVFNELKLIEQWGSGIQRMNSACGKAGLAAPKFEEIGTHFRVTLFLEKIAKPELDAIDQRILKLFRKGDALSTSVVAAKTGLSPRATLTRIKSLTAKGLLTGIGQGPHDPKRQYLLRES